MSVRERATASAERRAEGLGAPRRQALEVVVEQALSALHRDDPTALIELLREARRVENDRPLATSARPLSFRGLRDRRTRALLRDEPPPARAQATLRRLVEAHAEEIGFRFDPRVYRAIIAFGGWAFNAMSHLGQGSLGLPWGLADLLPSRITICGDVAPLQDLVRSHTVMLVPTHQSHNDILLFGHVLDRLGLPPVAWAAGLNLFRNPVLGRVLSLAGAYSVDRHRPSTAYRTTLLNYSAHLLAHGTHSLVFAGGGRSRSGAIESELRHGLLASALQAQDELKRAGSSRRVTLVPVTVSYHQVLEAPWLVDQYLASLGIRRPARRHGPTFRDAWRLHRSEFGKERSAIVRFGAAIDLSEKSGLTSPHSSGPAATHEERESALAQIEPISATLCDQLHRNAVVLPSQLVACALFESARAAYTDEELREWLGNPAASASVPADELRRTAELLCRELRTLERRGAVHLSPEFDEPIEQWLAYGIERLSGFHGPRLIELRGDEIRSRDLALLYYYRNRLRGFELRGPAPPSKSPLGRL